MNQIQTSLKDEKLLGIFTLDFIKQLLSQMLNNLSPLVLFLERLVIPEVLCANECLQFLQ